MQFPLPNAAAVAPVNEQRVDVQPKKARDLPCATHEQRRRNNDPREKDVEKDHGRLTGMVAAAAGARMGARISAAAASLRAGGAN